MNQSIVFSPNLFPNPLNVGPFGIELKVTHYELGIRLLDVGIEIGVIQKSGSFFRFNEEMLGQGREAVKVLLDENKKLATQIETEIWKKVKKEEKIPVDVGEQTADNE